MILVGDSLGQVMLGYEIDRPRDDGRDAPPHQGRRPRHEARARRRRHALPVLRDRRRGARRTPAASCARRAPRRSRSRAASAARRIIEALVKAGIPVMGHIGWTPQAQHGLGGKVRVQGKTATQARALLADALAVQEAGAFAIVLELVPEQLAAAITAAPAHPDDRHRRRRRLRRPGPGHHRPARPRRLHPEARASPTPHLQGDDRSRRRARTPRTSRPGSSRVPSRRSAWTTRSLTRPWVAARPIAPARVARSAASRSTATSRARASATWPRGARPSTLERRRA